MGDSREHAVTAAFVSISNSLVDGFDVVDLMSGVTSDCATLLDIDSAGLLLADPRRVLHVVAASSERTRSLELFQLQREQGPCMDCYRSGSPVLVPDLTVETDRWPQFVAAATQAGFASVHALPLRLRTNILGAMGLFGVSVGPLSARDLDLGQALAHVASVALVTDQAASDQAGINQQLQTALTSRVVIEQAKGLLAQSADLQMEDAFAVLRAYARAHGERLSEVARQIVARELQPVQVLEPARQRGMPSGG